MFISVQPKPICNEGVESFKHKQEALSKKSVFSVVMPVQSCQKNQKGIATCKRAGANCDSLGTPTHTASPPRDGHRARSSRPCTLHDPVSSPEASLTPPS